MSSAITYNLKGEAQPATSLPASLFGVKTSNILLAQAIRVFLGNQRTASAKTLTRSDVNRTKAKWFKQKGTGRARHGSRAAPIFVGGGISHGPDGTQNFSLKMPNKMRRTAFLGALSLKASNKKVFVISNPEKSLGKTKDVTNIFTKIGKGKNLVVVDTKVTGFTRAIRNIPLVTIAKAQNLNTYSVMAAGNLVLTPGAIEEMTKIYAK